MRVTVTDAAGNVAQGNPTRLTATSAKVGRRFRRIRSGRVKVPFGRRATLRGRLTLSAGQPFAGQTIVATSAIRRRGARARPAGSAVTDRRGRYAIGCPPAQAAPIASSSPAPAARSAGPRRVGARAGVDHDPRVAHASVRPGRVRFSGRLRTRGQRIPGRGLVLILQGRERGALAHVRGHADEPQGPLARRATPSAAGPGATRSGSASAASRATRSSSATRERLTVRVG